ncbi:MAG TPA: DUF4157 domain-containing protein [Planctomycetaceae bacterium]|nr:DUF4157 domain-containing protein [Planctomycetaceae bacterium]
MNASELFLHRDETDRSPSTWAERIALAFQPPATSPPAPDAGRKEAEPEPTPAVRSVSTLWPPSAERSEPALAARGAAPLQPLAGERSTPLPEAARRFLNPRVGFETRDVEMRQGPATSRALSAMQADAAAVGDSILLGPAHDPSTPAGLGLLAHELTHVVRGREPRFVPPAIRRTAGRTSATSLPGAAESQDESIAREMEVLTVQAAAGEDLPTAPGRRERAPANEPTDGGTATDSPAPRRPVAALPVTGAAEPPSADLTGTPDAAAQSRWGGLPAPWEPVPDYMTMGSPAGTPDVATWPQAAVAAPAIGVDGPGGEAAVQLAAQGRSLPEPGAGQPARAEASKQKPEKQAPPDLDHLARQVYSIMKRRLAAERRRELLQ